MEWKDAKLVKLVVASKLGGQLRLRTPNALKLNTGGALKKATGRNLNPFYQLDEINEPIVSPKATITPPELKETVMYDLPTRAGQTYTLLAQ